MAERAPIPGRVDADPGDRPARVLDGLPEAVICIAADGRITGAWGSCAEIFGERADAVLGTDAFDRLHPDDVAYAAGALAEAITRSSDHVPINLRVRAADGRWVLTETAAGYLGEPGTLLLSLRPLTFRGHMDERRADLQQRCLRIATSVAAAHADQLGHALIAAIESIHEFFHAAATRFCGPAELCLDVGEPRAWPAQTAGAAGTFEQHGRRDGRTVIEVRLPGGSRWWLAWAEHDPGVVGWDGAHVDDLQLAGAIVASAWNRLQLEADLLRRSRQDPLTGLANRAELERMLRRLLDMGPATVLFCDLDGYKQVNDLHGHAVGDQVLAAAAGRLNSALRAGDLLARVGGDEFVAVCPDLASADQPSLVARLHAALAEPIRVGSIEVAIGVSIGTAAGSPGTDAATLVAEADGAMYAVKTTRKSHR